MASSEPLTKSSLIGRKAELNQILKVMNEKEKSITLITGESGIGKTKFLDKINELLINDPKFLIGYYDRAIARPQSFIHPFSAILASLLVCIRNSMTTNQKIDADVPYHQL